MKITYVIGYSAALLIGLTVAFVQMNQHPKEQTVPVLDPERVVVLQTPGGMLEVATLQKVEEFGWQISHQCPLIDCGELLGKTTSEIKVTAHYTYRLPLAKTWSLQPREGKYELVVPTLEVKLPVAFETSGMQIRTEKSNWFSPAAGPNREAVVRQLGGELARRADRIDYRKLVQDKAALTIEQFAQKWMREQLQVQHPIKVIFRADAADKTKL